MTALVALLAGALIGTGLWLSGMTDPDNVLAFLDVAGAWRPGLALTMVAAIAIAAPAFAYARGRARAWNGGDFERPVRTRIDARLVFGSILFGIGWGLSGICPGPALILVATGVPFAAIFGAGFLIGVYAVDSLSPSRATRGTPACGSPSAQSKAEHALF